MEKTTSATKREAAPVADAEANDTTTADSPDEPRAKIYPQGWKLHALTVG